MASSSFRDSINSLGWSRATEEPVNTSRDTGLFSSIQNLNPFQDRGYLQLPTHETSPGAPLPASSRREEEEGWFILATRPRKFVLLWTVGSSLFLASFAAVMGPMNYVYHLLSTPRLPFTAAYFGSIIMTLAFAIKLQNTILTLLSALVQLAALAWYLVSYFPMGAAGLRLATTFGARQATSWMSG
ncbi:Protein transport protein SFT2 [Beauveria bassiana D1-5]|uniref:Protein transport protein SFT2 n=2 Tax=Beauveria bassiana TaxID=176275 RepID=J5JI07_BEAB2|nr:Golgi traffic protein SFT2, putative [Beauveria bassiana ARSEF 2860]EJP63071.1 Golgi traffic protein SFT2, putative [Beauveria bassiana ARSEF 2860]KGQ03037.1 Protein transport protein SFT2 [Beauveria bassiana D1-5]